MINTCKGNPQKDYAHDCYDTDCTRQGTRIGVLRQQKAVLQDYLQMKIDEEDWHGVQDAASDLRDIDSEIKGLKF